MKNGLEISTLSDWPSSRYSDLVRGFDAPSAPFFVCAFFCRVASWGNWKRREHYIIFGDSFAAYIFNKASMKIWHYFIHPITLYFRRKRGHFLLASFPNLHNYQICDLGGSRHFWEKLNLGIPPGQITVFNISEGETGSSAGSVEEGIRIVLYDGKRIPIEDGAVDLLVCNSVMEHVPPSQRTELASEMRRVAKRVFCQTPAYEFPIEPHFIIPFIHWLPRSLGFQLAKISPWRLLSRPSAAILRSYWWDTQLLTRREVSAIFPSAEILTEKFMGLTKSYYVIERPDNDN